MKREKVDYIDPMIGAVAYKPNTKDPHGMGKTFPGVTTPFGLIQLSPDTITGHDFGSGYSYEHESIEGFSFTHLSGVGWYGDLGNFLVTPTTGLLKTNRGKEENTETGYRSRFSHESEEAKAGYYSVTLSDYNIRAELSAAPHAGVIRLTFPQNKQSRIQIDLSRRVGGTSTEQMVKVENDHTISGWMKCPPEGGGWGNGNGKVDYTLYFHCEFSKPLIKYGVWRADIPEGIDRKRVSIQSDAYQKIVSNASIEYGIHEAQGKHLGFFTEFETVEDEQVLIKSGVSFVSVEGAKKNLENDIPHWDFEAVVLNAKKLWSNAIENVNVEGGEETDYIKFYTALYHTMIDPRGVSDVDGQYLAADGAVHKSESFTYRTIFSGWDVFRSQFPLQTIINPKMVNDEINSLLQIAEFSGKYYLPRWEMLNAFSGCMLGNPAVSIIVDAYEKGIRNYDIEQAFQICKNTVEKFTNQENGYSDNESIVISETLEYCYSDWCFSRFAKSLGKVNLAKKYEEKSKSYKSLWNEEVNWFRGKNKEDNWLEWKGKTIHDQGCIESNPYQQGWFVPHDIEGLQSLMGKDLCAKELTALFDKTPDDFLWNDYYNHANEPVHQVVFMFNEIGLPWLTQKWSRKTCEKAYGADKYGICGNEDVGQISAWYVLAASGFHPICPGDNKYQITSPVFNKITFTLDTDYYSGKTFTVIANNNSKENVYIQSIKLNGKPLNRYYIYHQELSSGGELYLEMGPKPNQKI